MSTEYINRIEVRSETSRRVYIVSQHKEKRFWLCSCPGWRTHRVCKHLKQMGLPCREEPYELPKKTGFLDGYPEYEGSAGDPRSWREGLAAIQESETPEPAPVTAPVFGRRIRTLAQPSGKDNK